MAISSFQRYPRLRLRVNSNTNNGSTCLNNTCIFILQVHKSSSDWSLQISISTLNLIRDSVFHLMAFLAGPMAQSIGVFFTKASIIKPHESIIYCGKEWASKFQEQRGLGFNSSSLQMSLRLRYEVVRVKLRTCQTKIVRGQFEKSIAKCSVWTNNRPKELFNKNYNTEKITTFLKRG